MGTFYGSVELVEAIFWMTVVGWTFLIGGWRWLEVYFWWVVLRGLFYKWAGISEGGWRHILGEWGWVKIFYVYVGVSGGIIWVV